MTTPNAPRVIAIDWSGAKSGERTKIWLAEVRDGCAVVRWSVAHLLNTSRRCHSRNAPSGRAEPLRGN